MLANNLIIIFILLIVICFLLSNFEQRGIEGFKVSTKIKQINKTRDQIKYGEKILRGQRLTSPSGKFVFVVQSGDGNVCLYDMKPKQKGMWCNMTHKGNTKLINFEKNGNLVQYSKSGKILWQSNTANSGAEELILNDDGYLILVDENKKIVWTLVSKDKKIIGKLYNPHNNSDSCICDCN